jgi:hypothetical protein
LDIFFKLLYVHRHDITEILLKGALTTITLYVKPFHKWPASCVWTNRLNNCHIQERTRVSWVGGCHTSHTLNKTFKELLMDELVLDVGVCCKLTICDNFHHLHFYLWQQNLSPSKIFKFHILQICIFHIDCKGLLIMNISEILISGLRHVVGFTPVSSTNKTDRYDITEILLKVALNTITLIPEILLPRH